MTAIAEDTTSGFHMLSTDDLVESLYNPRKHFDPTKLQELASSIREHGVLTPLLARPVEEVSGVRTYELAAGHRRFRAAAIVGIDQLPVVVREMTDTQLLEVLTIENLQRDDVHELEEAQGYADLIKVAGYTVERIAERIGMSVKYVYDRLKLLKLTPELKELFFAGKIAAGHAIILARLSAEDQKRAASYPKGGLWGHDEKWQTDLAGDQHEIKGFGAVQPQSVRQLQHWVDTHVRIDPERDADAQLFPELAAVAAPALEQEEKVVAITYNLFVHPDAKEDGERTYGPSTWKRADGKEKSRLCERSAVGVIVVGEGRGESFRVCVDKLKCKTHWGAEIAARAKRSSGSPSTKLKGSSSATPAGKSQWQIEEEERMARQAQWTKLLPLLIPAIAAHVKKAPAGGRSLLAQLIIDDVGKESKKAAAIVTRGTSAEDFVRYVAFQILHDQANRTYRAFESFPKLSKDIGLDLTAIIKANAPKSDTPQGTKPVFAKPATSTKTTKPKKKGRTPNAAFMKEMQVSEQLAAVIGKDPMVRTEVTKKLWGYIKRNSLQDPKERRMLMADEKLLPVFGGKKRVSMFEMTKLVNKHLKA